MVFKPAPGGFQRARQVMGEGGVRRPGSVMMMRFGVIVCLVVMEEFLQVYVKDGEVDLAEFAHGTHETFRPAHQKEMLHRRPGFAPR
jgi:hypothetical protein